MKVLKIAEESGKIALDVQPTFRSSSISPLPPLFATSFMNVPFNGSNVEPRTALFYMKTFLVEPIIK